MITHWGSLNRTIIDVFREGVGSSCYVWGMMGKDIACKPRPMDWKGTHQPKTLERAFQVVETAQEEMGRRGHGVLRTRGRLVWLQLSEEHTFGDRREPWKAFEEGCHRPLKCLQDQSGCEPG